MTGMVVRVTYGCRHYDINRLRRYDRRDDWEREQGWRKMGGLLA